MSTGFSVGVSSYDDLRGVEQFVATERMALQILSVKVDFDQMKADQGSGDRLSINEGKRSRARQDYLWANRVALGVVVAPPYTSRHDEIRNGNAIDVGVTMADGRNRALTAAEFEWLHAQVERRGGTWTGRNFGEPWHHEMATRAEVVPPYPDARAIVAAGPTIKTTTTPVGDIVNTFIIKVDNGKGAWDAFLANPETMRILPLGGTALAFWKARGVTEQPDVQARQVLGNFELVKGKGA